MSQGRSVLIRQSFGQDRHQEFFIEGYIAVRGEVVKTYLVVEPPDRSMVEVCQHVRGTDEDPLEALQASEELVGQAYFPGMLCVCSIVEHSVHLIHNQDGLILLGLFEHAAYIPLRHAHERIKDITGSSAHDLPLQVFTQVPRELALACTGGAIEQYVHAAGMFTG